MESTLINVDDVTLVLDAVTLERLAADEGQRLQLIASAKKMLSRLETPFEQVWILSQVSVTVAAVCRVLRDAGLWAGWLEAGSKNSELVTLMGY